MKTNEFNTEYFHVTSYGNGWAYEVHDNRTGDSFFLQDESATIFHEECEAIGWDEVCQQYMEALSE